MKGITTFLSNMLVVSLKSCISKIKRSGVIYVLSFHRKQLLWALPLFHWLNLTKNIMLLSTRDKVFCSLIVVRLSLKEVNFCWEPKAILLVASPEEVSLFSASFLFDQWEMFLSFAGIVSSCLEETGVWKRVKELPMGEIEIEFWKYLSGGNDDLWGLLSAFACIFFTLFPCVGTLWVAQPQTACCSVHA